MHKIFSFMGCASLTVLSCVVLAGCQSGGTQASSNQQPAAAAPASAPLAPTASAPMATAAVATAPAMIRVKAGVATPFKDSSGNVWLADQGFDGGDVIERPENAIANTKEQGLYQAEHYGMSSFSTKLANGKYLAKLHFAETYEGISGKGERVFSFKVQGQEFKDFDVFAKAGGANRAYVETVPVEVTNGVFKIDFISNIEFPEINAIEVVPAP
jgi:hypothetical protein